MSMIILIVDDNRNKILTEASEISTVRLINIKLIQFSFLKIAMGMLVKITNMYHHDLSVITLRKEILSQYFVTINGNCNKEVFTIW